MTTRPDDARPRRAPLALAAALAVGAVVATGGRGAEAQTLREALAEAYANNPLLQAARAQLRVVDENVPQALAGWRPTVVGAASAGAVDGNARQRVFQPVTDEFGFPTGATRRTGNSVETDRSPYSVSGTVTQPLYRGGRTVSSVRRAENQVLAQRARLLATEQQVLGDGVSAYLDVIRAQEEVRLNLNNVQVLQRQLDATNERFRVGEITRTDVAQAESRLAGARSTRAEAEGGLQNSRAVFQRIFGTAPGRLTAPQPLRPPGRSSEEVQAAAGANNPNVVAALFDEAAARDFVDVQFAALLPNASLQAQAARNDNQAQPGSRTTANQITATLSVPLYQGGAEYAAVRAARQDAVRLRQVVDDQRRTAVGQAAQAWETLTSARATAEATRAQIRAAEIALDGVQREAVVGSRTTLDVLNAEQELLNARVTLVRNLRNVVVASHNLAAAVGRLTARDLALPVTLYDDTSYYRAVRDRWFGYGDYGTATATVLPDTALPVSQGGRGAEGSVPSSPPPAAAAPTPPRRAAPQPRPAAEPR